MGTLTFSQWFIPKHSFFLSFFVMSTIHTMSPEARKANVDAKKYHQQRQSETAHSFDELEFDYPTVNERIDPENA